MLRASPRLIFKAKSQDANSFDIQEIIAIISNLPKDTDCDIIELKVESGI